MENDPSSWKRCSTCKREIAFHVPYFACSVSTCNRKGTDFAFCSVDCWDAHVPTYRHRDAWADEKTSPTADEWAREQAQRPAEPVRRVVTPASAPAGVSRPTSTPTTHASDDDAGEPPAPGAVPRDVLVVVSKIKSYVKITSGMNTSDDVVDPLSDRLRIWLDDAIDRARADGRKTVMARDFRRQS
jgi:hypothetical protein